MTQSPSHQSPPSILSRKLFVYAVGLHVAIAGLLFIFHQWRGSVSVKILFGMFCAFFLYATARGAYAMGMSRKVFGARKNDHWLMPHRRLRELFGAYRMYAEKGEDVLVHMVFCYAIMIIITGAIANWWWIGIGLFLHAVVSPHAARRTWPGFTLVLSGSRDKAAKSLVNCAVSATRPFNTTHLLNFIGPDEMVEAILQQTGVRVTNPIVSWEAAVAVHALFAKVIVLNCGTITEDVVREIKALDNYGLWHKVVVFGNNVPATELRLQLDRHTSQPVAGAVFTQNLTEVWNAVAKVTSNLESFPSPQRPLAP